MKGPPLSPEQKAVVLGDPAPRHQCPAPGCDYLVNQGHLFCPAHWSMVSEPLQKRLYAAYYKLKAAPSAEQLQRDHARAMHDCVEEVKHVAMRRAERRKSKVNAEAAQLKLI
jgi:hypothetical protein